ncbi:MAG: DNA replication/repair protein RecF [Candidatus Dojkabacteria bacterium]
MIIKSIKLKNYKNLDLELDFNDQLNLIVAPNGTGKTNLLEAINYLADGSSFRAIGDEYIMPENKKGSSISSVIVGDIFQDSGVGFGLRVAWHFPAGEKNYFFNEKKSNLQKFKRNFHTTVHAPASMDVVSGPSSNRRQFLDRSLQNLRPGLKQTFSDFRKALTQKNRLLGALAAGKITLGNARTQLPFWNEKLVQFGDKITQERLTLLETIKPFLEEIAGEVYHLDEFKLEYIRETKGDFKEIFAGNMEKELVVGRCLYGAHKDSYEFLLNGKDIRNASSRGQQRLFSLILHLAVAKLVDSEREELGVLLLDDIFSELDPEHRSKTMNYLIKGNESGEIGQIFITSPDERDLKTTKLRESILSLY